MAENLENILISCDMTLRYALKLFFITIVIKCKMVIQICPRVKANKALVDELINDSMHVLGQTYILTY